MLRGVLLVVSLTGDGGNDVSMIQAANVGVGIIGKVSIDSCYKCYHLANITHRP